MIRQEIEKALQAALKDLGVETSFVLERPAMMEHGDYATNIALSVFGTFAKSARGEGKAVSADNLGWTIFGGREKSSISSPRALAELLKIKFDKQKIEGVEKIEIAGAGFINFFLSHDAITKEVAAAAHEKEWGRSGVYAGKKVMVEYTDPNPFKEFHIGHLMSNAIGESIARLFEFSGAEVRRVNYQGDVGLHVAKALFALLEKNIESPTIQDIGKAYVEGATRYEESDTDKKAIDILNKNIYEKTDERVNLLYKKGLALSLARFEEIYEALGMKVRDHFGELKYFDYYFFESASSHIGKVIVENNTPNVFEKSDGAVVFRGEKYNPALHTRVFLTSQGLPTYEAKELGLLKSKINKWGWDFDESITITANEQTEYFKVVLTAAMQISELVDAAKKTKHIVHGMMRFAEGKMSSRKGNVITGESLLMDLREAAKEKMQDRQLIDVEKVAQDVAVGAIKYTVLKQGSGKDIIFDPEKSLSLEGDSGPYLQYAHTRAQSLIRKASEAQIVESQMVDDQDTAELTLAMRLHKVLIHYPEVVARAARELEPHYVTTYLTELAATFNSWYATDRVIVDGKIDSHILLLVQAVEQTLAKGLEVLGIPVPHEM